MGKDINNTKGDAIAPYSSVLLSVMQVLDEGDKHWRYNPALLSVVTSLLCVVWTSGALHSATSNVLRSGKGSYRSFWERLWSLLSMSTREGKSVHVTHQLQTKANVFHVLALEGFSSTSRKAPLWESFKQSHCGDVRCFFYTYFESYTCTHIHIHTYTHIYIYIYI